MALHALEAHPDIGLDVSHQMADMDRPVGVGESRGHEDAARGHGQNELKALNCNKHSMRGRRLVAVAAMV
ncbi:hypothetical protein D3C83_211410 [compost metagenome]